MVWHIFKKDWELLWPFCLAVAVTQFIPAIIRLKLGLFGEDPTLQNLLIPAMVVAMVGSAFLVASIVQQDSIPGVRQDWLVRPVRRTDLLLAKIFFVLVLVQGATVAADVFQMLASGFPLGQSLTAAVAHNAFLMLLFTLPVLALASVTRNLTEAIVGGVLAFCGLTAVLFLSILVHGGEDGLYPTNGTGVSWIRMMAAFLGVLLGVCAVVGIQYFRRKTSAARWLAAVPVLWFMLLQNMAWKPAFALQQRLSPDPGAARSISLAFAPGAGKFQRPSGMTMSDEEMWKHLHQNEARSQAFLPLHLAGLPSDTVLKADKSEVRFLGPDGKVVYRGTGEDLEIRKEGRSDGEATIHQEIDVPSPVYNRFKDQLLRLEIDYSLTLFRLGSSYGIPALGGDQRMPEVGWCATQMNEYGSGIELHCMQAGKSPTCATVFLENVSSGLRNPAVSACEPDYSPFLEPSNASPASGFVVNLRFRDPSGLAHFPVDGPQLPKSQVVMRIYEPADHFTRQLVIPAISIKDWESK